MGIGILYLLTCGFCGVGWIIDIIKSIIEILSSKKIHIILTIYKMIY